MLALALVIGLLVGIALGQKYKVFVLAPVFALVLMLAAAMAVTHPQAMWPIAEATMVTLFGLQTGYVVGISLRHVALVVRAGRLRTLSMRDSAPSRRPAL